MIYLGVLFLKLKMKLKVLIFSLFQIFLLNTIYAHKSTKIQYRQQKVLINKKEYSKANNEHTDSILRSKHIKKESLSPSLKTKEIIPNPTSPPFFNEDVNSNQISNPENTKDSIVLFPDYDAQFPGGSDAQKEFIRKNLNFPKIMEQMDFEGWVLVKFLVHSTGEISQIQIERGLHEELDFEAINVIKKMPLWNPAVYQNRKVPTYVFTSVWFNIER
jgi:outer membrane biosynthesis protein TonB